jgi:hypothetical protein
MKNVITKLGLGLSSLLIVTAFAGTAHAFQPVGVPEVDPGSMGAAMALLVGGYLITASRLRRK